MTEHEWKVVIRGADHQTFATCLKCGLSRLTTMNGEFYFVQMGKPYLQCSSPYKESKMDVTL